jgi:hypothetical protein
MLDARHRALCFGQRPGVRHLSRRERLHAVLLLCEDALDPVDLGLVPLYAPEEVQLQGEVVAWSCCGAKPGQEVDQDRALLEVEPVAENPLLSDESLLVRPER